MLLRRKLSVPCSFSQPQLVSLGFLSAELKATQDLDLSELVAVARAESFAFDH